MNKTKSMKCDLSGHPLFTMRHYWWRKGDKIVVQNMVAGMCGQKHEHTKEDFRRWVKEGNIKPENLIDVGKK